MKKLILLGSILSSQFAFAEDKLLERFNDHNACKRFGWCHEYQTSSFAKKERARGGAISACNMGPENITLKIRRKAIRRWETVKEQVVAPNKCHSIKYDTNHVAQRGYELKVNSNEGTTYHMVYTYREVFHDVPFSIFSDGPY